MGRRKGRRSARLYCLYYFSFCGKSQWVFVKNARSFVNHFLSFV
ncbi:hypothetical protein HMPREF0262_03552 [Clostridium sp. ATCC 29733]|nr:hypothetical protein HMPREF0262_03552 [Clostridium sp. ATCC 29733]